MQPVGHIFPLCGLPVLQLPELVEPAVCHLCSLRLLCHMSCHASAVRVSFLSFLLRAASTVYLIIWVCMGIR